MNQNISPIQHDDTNYGVGFIIGRGNLTSIKRWDSTAPYAAYVRTQGKYNTAGSVVSTLNELDKETKISYADSFKDGINRNTFAYPTSVYDPDNNTSVPTGKVEYDYYMGVVTRTEGKAPAGQSQGAIVIREYDDPAGRLTKILTVNNQAYTRYVYPDTGNYIQTYTTITSGQGEALSETYFDGVGRAILSRTKLPNDNFVSQKAEYDTMGRMKRQSVPTETDPISGNPTGDDNRGLDGNNNPLWLWTSQTYDWKGRPLVTTNTDGTTKEASYSGCGCAGGEVVTLKEETLAEGRRTIKNYSDVFGREYKSEIYNWDETTVYTTFVRTLDALNRVTKIRQYEGTGAIANPRYQETTFSYDGYSRLSQQHTPVQTAGTFTTWTYRADGTVNTTTDSRGVVATYSYNNRGQITNITFDEPTGSNIPDTPDVNYQYDAVGNRTQMNDGLGAVFYEYDELSRLKSEKREFNFYLAQAPLPNYGYKIIYEYDLANQLKKVTDPFGYEINYGYDKLGRLNTVAGTPFGNHNGSYIQQMSYRSWGAMKSITYGNNVTASASYNNRLQMNSFELRHANFQLAMQAEYQYYNDGKLKYAKDLLASHFDRAYAYDFVGRMTEAYTGNEARNFVNGTTGGYWDGPYRESFQQNVYGNLTSETSRLWSNDPEAKNYSFVNGRNTSYQYDSAGHILNDGQVQYVFDAKGLITSMTKIGTTKTHSVVYDGDGQAVKRSVPPRIGNSANVITYHLRSSVLGSIITEINSQGGRKKGFVYANGQTLAEQINISYSGDFVKLYHFKPLVNSLSESTNDGLVSAKEERDPTGMNVGLEDPIQTEIPEPIAPIRQNGGGGGLFGPSCYLDGIETDCGQVMRLAEMGALQIQVQNRQGETRYVDLEVILGVLHIPGHEEYASRVDYSGANIYDDNGNIIGWDPQGITIYSYTVWIQDMFLPLGAELSLHHTSQADKDHIKAFTTVNKNFKNCLDANLFGSIVPMDDSTADLLLWVYFKDNLDYLDLLDLAITFYSESSPKWNFNPPNQPNDGTVGNLDVGPGQLNYNTWNNHPWLAGLDMSKVFGTAKQMTEKAAYNVKTKSYEREVFNGSPFDNLRATSRVLQNYGHGADAVAKYRTGTGPWSKTEDGKKAREARINEYNTLVNSMNDFLSCLLGLRKPGVL